jgi:heme/copper-type cytochrome/quinol oxidase subunit 3
MLKMKIMKIPNKFLIFSILLAFSQLVSASRYIEMLKELDVRILCLLLLIGPLAALVLLSISGVMLIISDSPLRREEARRMIYNTILGLLLVLAFIIIATHLAELDLGRCI